MSEKIREIVDSALEQGSREFDSVFSYSKSSFKSEKDRVNTENDLQKLKTRIIQMIEENFFDVDWSKNDSVENFCEKLTHEIISQINEMRFKKALSRVIGVNPNESWVKFIRWIGDLRLKTKQEIFKEIGALKREKKEYVPYPEVPTFHYEGSDLDQNIEDEPEVEPEEIPLPPEVPTLDPEEPAPFIFTSTLDHYLSLLADSTTFVDGISDLVQKNDPDLVEGVILSLLERIEQLKKNAQDAEELWEQAEASRGQVEDVSKVDELKALLAHAENALREKESTLENVTKKIIDLQQELKLNEEFIQTLRKDILFLQSLQQQREEAILKKETEWRRIQRLFDNLPPSEVMKKINELKYKLENFEKTLESEKSRFHKEIDAKNKELKARERKIEDLQKELEIVKKQMQEQLDLLSVQTSTEVELPEVLEEAVVSDDDKIFEEKPEDAQATRDALQEELDFVLEVATEYEGVISEQKVQIENLKLVVDRLQVENEKRNFDVTQEESSVQKIEGEQSMEQFVVTRRALLLEKIDIIDRVISENQEQIMKISGDIRILDGEIIFFQQKEDLLDGFLKIGILENEGVNVRTELREIRSILLTKEQQKTSLIKERENCDQVYASAKKSKDLCTKHLQALDLLGSSLPEVQDFESLIEPKHVEVPFSSEKGKEKSVPFVEPQPKVETEIDNKDEITKVEGLPFSVEFTREQELQVRSLEQWIQQFRGLSKEQIEKEFPLRADEKKSTFETKKERYDKMVEALLDGTFLSKLKMAIVILGSMRGESGQFVGRIGSKVAVYTRSRAVGLAKDVTQGNQMTSLVYGQVENFPEEFALIKKVYKGSKFGLTNDLTPFGEGASCVWTRDLLDEGQVTKKQLAGAYTIVNEWYADSKKKEKES